MRPLTALICGSVSRVVLDWTTEALKSVEVGAWWERTEQHGFPLKGISYPRLCPYMLCLSAASRGTTLLCYALPTIVSLGSSSER